MVSKKEKIVKPKSKSQSPVPTGPKVGPYVQTKSEKSKNLILWTGADTIITWTMGFSFSLSLRGTTTQKVKT